MKNIKLEMWEDIEYSDVYASDTMSISCKFSLCNLIRDTWVQQTPELKCRDTLSLGLVCAKSGYLMEGDEDCNGVILDRDFMGLDNLYLTVRSPKIRRVKYILPLLHNLEKLYGTEQRTEIFKVSSDLSPEKDKNIIAVLAPKMWIKSVPLLSLFTLIIRTSLFATNARNFSSIKSLLNNIKKVGVYKPEYLDHAEKTIDIEFLIKNLDFIFEDELGLFGDELSEWDFNNVSDDDSLIDRMCCTGILAFRNSGNGWDQRYKEALCRINS